MSCIARLQIDWPTRGCLIPLSVNLGRHVGHWAGRFCSTGGVSASERGDVTCIGYKSNESDGIVRLLCCEFVITEHTAPTLLEC